HRTACEIKIHPDVSRARIDSVCDRPNQTRPHILRLRWCGLVGRRSGIVLAHSSPPTTHQEEQTNPEADEASETLPRHAALLASSYCGIRDWRASRNLRRSWIRRCRGRSTI